MLRINCQYKYNEMIVCVGNMAFELNVSAIGYINTYFQDSFFRKELNCY